MPLLYLLSPIELFSSIKQNHEVVLFDLFIYLSESAINNKTLVAKQLPGT